MPDLNTSQLVRSTLDKRGCLLWTTVTIRSIVILNANPPPFSILQQCLLIRGPFHHLFVPVVLAGNIKTYRLDNLYSVIT